MAGRQGLPVIVEIFEAGSDFEGVRVGGIELRGEESVAEAGGFADGEAAALIEACGCGIDGESGVPEEAEKARAIGVIPDEAGDRAAGARDASKFGEGAGEIGNEIEAEAAEGCVEGGVVKWESHGIGERVGDARVRTIFARKVDLRCGAIHSGDEGR